MTKVANANTGSTWAPVADLASNANGYGAALIGIEDPLGLITATTVEGALAELAGSAATESSPVFTYRVGGTNAGRTFNSLAGAYAAAFALGTVCAIAIDDATIPGQTGMAVTGAIGAMDLTNIDLVCGPTSQSAAGTQIILTFQTGTTVKRFRQLIGVELRSTSTAAILSFGGSANDIHQPFMNNASIIAGSVADFVTGANGGGTCAFVPYMMGRSFLKGTSGQRAVSATAGAIVAPRIFDASGYNSTAFGGAGTFVPLAQSPGATAGSDDILPTTQANVSGTYAVGFDVFASQVSAVDTAPAISSTTVQGQLDALKAKLITPICPMYKARGVVLVDVPTLSAFVVAQNGVTYVAGDVVLLANQATAAQCGLYLVGTVSGTAPLTRIAALPAAAVGVNGTIVQVSEGTLFAGSEWKAMATTTGGYVVGTNDPLFYPRVCQGTLTLSSGTKTLGSADGLWLFSTALAIHATPNTAGGTTTLSISYGSTTASRTAGKSGTAAAIILARVAAGSIQNQDNSTVDWSVQNW